MTTPITFFKDPNATLDYVHDWSAWLDGDTIQASSWTVPAGMTITKQTFDSTTATVWLSGGTVDTTYRITNTITTVGGRTDQRTSTIVIVER